MFLILFSSLSLSAINPIPCFRKPKLESHTTKNLFESGILVMELLTLIVSVLLAMSFLSAPCASDQLNLNKQSECDHAMFAQPSLPRKLMNLNHEIAKSSSSEEDLAAHGEFPPASSGTKQHEKEENFINAEEDDDEEEGSNKSEYFTMDYRWVRRRRPIHNKQIPFVP